MTDRYKKIVIDNEYTRGIYIFVGNLKKDFDVTYKRNQDDKKFNDIITADMKRIIKKMDGDIYFIGDIIYDDDTISNIKKKIIAGTELPIVYDELYLFSKNDYHVEDSQLYKILSNNGKRDITHDSIEKLLLNMDGIDKPIPRDIQTFSYNDIVDLNISGDRSIFTTIGMNTGSEMINTMYVIDPYRMKGIDKYTTQHYTELATISETSLLMDYPRPSDDIIYVRTVTEVVETLEKQDISPETIIGMYFPLLHKKSITTIELFDSKRESLLKKTQEMINDKHWINNNRIVDTMHDIYNKDHSMIDYIKKGISSISVSIGDGIGYKLPLENIFKILTSSEKCPIVKYNPGKVHENIYRLFSDRKTSSGEKIPLLSKSTILNLVKKIGLTPNSISMYCEIAIEGNDTRYDVFISIAISGMITVSIDFETPVEYRIIDAIIENAYSTIINKTRSYTEIIGYDIPEFNGIMTEPTKIRSITYDVLIPHKKTFDVKNVTKCMSAVFGVTSNGKNSTLRFKRVSNYNDMSAHTAYIIEMVNDRYTPQDIIRGLIDKFGLKEDVATDKVTTFLSNVEITTEMYGGTKPIIYNSPGLPVNVTLESLSTEVKISILNIPSLNYIDTLDVYIASFIRIAEKPSLVPSRLCTTGRPKVVNPIEDIIVDNTPRPVTMDEFVPDENRLTMDVPDEAMADFLLGMDDDDDDDDDDGDDDVNAGVLSDDDNSVSDGEYDEVVRDLSGTRLNNPNPISKRLFDREPKLFMKKDGTGFSSYSRMCPSSLKRQPIILTDKEKKYIDKHHPGSYNHSIKYQTSHETEPHHYICPRYWSLRDNVSLTEKEVKDKHAGEVIGSNDKTIKPGQHIYEFDKSYHRDKKGEYAGTYPGFMTLDSHIDGMCIPCCFKQWDGVRQRELRDTCETAIGPPTNKLILLDNKSAGDMYIIGSEGFPIPRGRYGYLPLSIQRFLDIDNKDYQISETDTTLKPNTYCLLRAGVELHKTQSFIGALASVYDIPYEQFTTIQEMKKIIQSSLTLDRFITAQNGTLVDTFYNDKNENPDVTAYKDTRIFMRMNGDENMEDILKRYISSYENFIDFLDDPDLLIDYTYLWDIVCMPNANLFEHGINLIILDISNEDASDNVSMICPPIQYNSKFGDKTRRHAILIKRDNYYEHLISFKYNDYETKIERTFSTLYKWMIPSIQRAIRFIKKNINIKCSPNKSLPSTVYEFEQGVSLDTCVTTLLHHKYIIHKQVMNYNGKIIGLIVKHSYNTKHNDKSKIIEGYLPCIPSGVLPILRNHSEPGEPVSDEDGTDKPIDILWIEQFKGYPYKDTVEFLNHLNKKTNGVLKCKPHSIVNSGGLIVAIITETNHLIPVEPDDDISNGDLDVVKTETDLLTIDKDRGTDHTNLSEFTNKVHLEGEIYTAFKAIIKRFIHIDTNRSVLGNIKEVIYSTDNYKTKMEKLIDILNGVSKKCVKFIKGYDTKDMIGNVVIPNITSRSTSASKDISTRGFLKVPINNLVDNNVVNSVLYHARLSDEIIRYMDTRNYMLIFEKIIAPQDIRYKLNIDEILIYQSSLTKSYFDGLNNSDVNPYIHNKTWEMASPQNEPVYNHKIDIEYMPSECEEVHDLPVLKIKKMIPVDDFYEVVFPNRPECSFGLLAKICSEFSDPSIRYFTIDDIKQVLIEEYTRYYTEYNVILLEILEENVKQLYSKEIREGHKTFDTIILRNDYTLSHMDIWVFSNKFKIPIIILWDGIFVETTSNVIITHNSLTGDYFFVRMKGNEYDPKAIVNPYERSYRLIRKVNSEDRKSYDYIINKKYVTPYLINIIDNEPENHTLNEITLLEFNRTKMRKEKNKKLAGIKVAKKGKMFTIK